MGLRVDFMDLEIKTDYKRIIVNFAYCPDIVKNIKQIGGGKWNPLEKSWYFIYSLEKYEQLLKLKNEKECKVKEQNTDIDKDAILPYLITPFENLLKLKGYSAKTIKAYTGHLRRFLEYINYDERRITYEELEKYSLHLLDDKKASHSYVNQGINSMKFYLKNVKKDNQKMKEVVRPKKEKKLPVVLSEKEVYRILDVLDNKKHRTILMLTYSAGLRVSEVTRLQKGRYKGYLRVHVKRQILKRI